MWKTQATENHTEQPILTDKTILKAPLTFSFLFHIFSFFLFLNSRVGKLIDSHKMHLEDLSCSELVDKHCLSHQQAPTGSC